MADVLSDYAEITEYLAAFGLEPCRDQPEWRVESEGPDPECLMRVLLVTDLKHCQPGTVLVHTSHQHGGQCVQARGWPWNPNDRESLPEAVRQTWRALSAAAHPIAQRLEQDVRGLES